MAEDSVLEVLRKLRKKRKVLEPKQPNVNINLNITVDKQTKADEKGQPFVTPSPSG